MATQNVVANVHNSIIQNSQKGMQHKYPSTVEWIKKIMVYPYYEILLNNKKNNKILIIQKHE